MIKPLALPTLTASISVADDGRTFDPFDYFSRPTIPLGVVHLHPGKTTPLQIGAGSDALLASWSTSTAAN